ncbi:hypothetical protein [Sorangium sp. So ce1153]|uniref:hypothetical protein n=1 Tax=Sorangium sp. So ce1153 TaxID=3133333 RepID=UPI003F614631
MNMIGNARAEEVSTRGVDLTLEVTRTFKNDTERWVLGQLEMEKECSGAAGLSQCRLLARTTTIYGEIEPEGLDSDDGIPDTKLDVVVARDAFGNVTGVTADDAFGHHRSWSTTSDPNGNLTFTSDVRTLSYDDPLHPHAVTVAGADRFGYDELGRIETITYPTPAGAAPFMVAYDHDAHGHVLAVRDSAIRLFTLRARLVHIERLEEEIKFRGLLYLRRTHYSLDRSGCSC